jgi:hypothetical protein
MSVSRCLLLLAISTIGTLATSAQELTVMELLQSPRQFEGRRVTVSGYYYSDWEGHSLFADLKTAKAFDCSRSLWIQADPNVESNIRKTRISGVFFYSRKYDSKVGNGGFGHMGLFPAALINCTVRFQSGATFAPNQRIELTPARRPSHISQD